MSYLRHAAIAVLAFALAGSLALAHGDDAYTVLAGAGQDTTVLSAFFPETIRVSVGTTVTWRLEGDEIHTVTFVPDHEHEGVAELPPFVVPAPEGEQGMIVNPRVAFPTRAPGSDVERFEGHAYVNSGIMSHEPMGPDQPANDSFSLTFTEPGTYHYHCTLHPWMEGTVIVEEEPGQAESHEAVDTRGEAQILPLLTLVETIRQQAEPVKREPGPDGTTIWYVEAGAVDFMTGDPRASAFDFFPQHLTIESGDTVVWSSPEFHTVSFVPSDEVPPEIMPQEQEQGPPLLFVNPEVFGPVKPDGVYDATQYYNSGVIGRYAELGHSWALTFDQPGTYEYVCIIHDQMGMEGTITVVERE